MEIPAKIVFFSDGRYELYVQEKDTDMYIEVSEAELKTMAERQKSKKRPIKISDEPEIDLTKEYEEGAKEKIKAFLKKKLSERKAKKAKKPSSPKQSLKEAVKQSAIHAQKVWEENKNKTTYYTGQLTDQAKKAIAKAEESLRNSRIKAEGGPMIVLTDKEFQAIVKKYYPKK